MKITQITCHGFRAGDFLLTKPLLADKIEYIKR